MVSIKTKLLLTAAIAVGHPVTAVAQDKPAPAVEEAQEGLSDIVVTARKNRESLTQVPLAVTALTSEDIQARGVKSLYDLATFTPGFRQQSQSIGRNDRGFTQYIIRGIVPNTPLPSRQTVTVFVDGAPVTGGVIAGVTDIERVEVVKGPQSAFFGRATFGGAVSIITRQPGYKWGGNVDATYERFATSDLNASVEGPIIDGKLAFRLSGRAYHTDGAYTDSVRTGERLGRRNTQSLSLALRADPTDNVNIKLFGVHWSDSDGLPANAIYTVNQFNCNSGAAPAGTNNYVCGALGTAPSETRTWNGGLIPSAYAQLKAGAPFEDKDFIDHLGLERRATQLRSIVTWDAPGGYTVSGTAAYSRNKWSFLQTTLGVDTTSVANTAYTPGSTLLPNTYLLIRGDVDDQDVYGEVRISSPQDRPVHGAIGATYQDTTTQLIAAAFTNVGPLTFTSPTNYGSKSYALFGSATVDFSQSLSLSAEGRYQWDKGSETNVGGNPPSFKKTFKSFAPRAILAYKPDSSSSIYASFSVGNRPGEFNGLYYALPAFAQAQITTLSDIQGVVKEDRLEMGEIGYKAQLFDNRLRILAAAYYGLWTDRHVQNTLLVYISPAAQQQGTLSQVSLTAPSGKVRLSGLELELTFKASSALTLDGNFALANTNIRKTSCSDCVTLTGNTNPVGNQLPYYPKITAALGSTYERPIGDYNGFVRADLIYTGRQYDTEANLAYTPGFVSANLRVGAERDGYRVELFGTNIFNNKTATSLALTGYTRYNPNGSSQNFNAITVSLPQPVSYGVRLSKKF